jgi:nitrite reductase (NO-forming)
MTAQLERPPVGPPVDEGLFGEDVRDGARNGVPRPAPRDVPWPSTGEGAADATVFPISASLAALFGLFGLAAMLVLGVVLGSRGPVGLPGAASGARGVAPVTLDVTATDFKFAPAELTVAGPTSVTISLQNKGAVEHDVTVEGVAGKAYAKPGQTSSATFKLAKPGSYAFFCSLPGHKEAGMVGTLVVGGGAVTNTRAQPASGIPAPAAPAVLAPAVAGVKPLPVPSMAPPLNRSQPSLVRVELETREVTAQLADGVTYRYWTFNGTVPGPMIRVRQGDTVDLMIHNTADSSITHSIDLHAVTGPGGGAKVTQVAAGGMAEFTFTALNPGVYVYHCATPMVAQHIANGMYGMIVVEPEGGLTPVDHEFYVMQGDVYTTGTRGQPGHVDISVPKMLDERADYVVFNGGVGNVTGPNALQARVGETVRIFFGDGGPNLPSSFHVIGEIFDKVYPEGAIGSPPEANVQTTHVSTGGATVVEFTVQVPGDYTLVDHSLGRLEKGAAGVLHVEGPQDPTIFNAGTVGGAGSGGH